MMAEERLKEKMANMSRKGIDVIAGYDSWAETYDETLYLCYGRDILSKEILQHFPSAQRRSIRVLDVAAGTGKVGKNLQKEGFMNIDAIEPSKGMMNKLKESTAYTNKYLEAIGTGGCTVPSDTYDLVVMFGAMAEGHVPVSGIDDLIRVAKKDGLVMIIMREQFLESVEAYKDKLEPYMEEKEKKGQWIKVDRRVIANYCLEYNGVMFTYRVL